MRAGISVYQKCIPRSVGQNLSDCPCEAKEFTRHSVPSRGVVVWSLSHDQLFCNPMDCSPPGSSVHGISQQGYSRGLSLPSPGDLPDPGIKPESPASSLPLSHQGSPSRGDLLSISSLLTYNETLERGFLSLQERQGAVIATSRVQIFWLVLLHVNSLLYSLSKFISLSMSFKSCLLQEALPDYNS